MTDARAKAVMMKPMTDAFVAQMKCFEVNLGLEQFKSGIKMEDDSELEMISRVLDSVKSAQAAVENSIRTMQNLLRNEQLPDQPLTYVQEYLMWAEERTEILQLDEKNLRTLMLTPEEGVEMLAAMFTDVYRVNGMDPKDIVSEPVDDEDPFASLMTPSVKEEEEEPVGDKDYEDVEPEDLDVLEESLEPADSPFIVDPDPEEEEEPSEPVQTVDREEQAHFFEVYETTLEDLKKRIAELHMECANISAENDELKARNQSLEDAIASMEDSPEDTVERIGPETLQDVIPDGIGDAETTEEEDADPKPAAPAKRRITRRKTAKKRKSTKRKSTKATKTVEEDGTQEN